MLFSQLKKVSFKGKIDIIDCKGKIYSFGQSTPYVKIKLQNKSIERKIFINPALFVGEAYMSKELIIEEGTIEDFINILTASYEGVLSTHWLRRYLDNISTMFRWIQQLNYPLKSKKNVAHHYDISEKLYDLFLDKKRQYSCAYFKNENDTLEDAQNNKIDHIIKKLNLKPNQRVLDIGSGWGTLAIDIAQKTKCEVVGITLSENQLKYSKQKAKELNLKNQVEFRLMDYRELDEKFDRVVSVGMFEHVGRKFYKTYFNTVSKLLNEDGIALIHTIGSVNPPRDPHPWITKYIFPGGYTPSLSELASPIEKSGLSISDMEVLRMHYSHTLRHWKERFLSKKETVLEMFDEKFFRMWEFYLASCEMAFKWGDQVVFQFQLTKKFTSTPNTRDYIY